MRVVGICVRGGRGGRGGGVSAVCFKCVTNIIDVNTLVQVAAFIGDEMLVCEGGLRIFNCLGPMIAAAKSPHLLTPLAGCHAAIAELKDVTNTTFQVKTAIFQHI